MWGCGVVGIVGIVPMEIRPPGRLASCGRRKRGSVRCSGDAFIAPTASQTKGRNLPPEGVWVGGGEAEGGAEGVWEGVGLRRR